MASDDTKNPDKKHSAPEEPRQAAGLPDTPAGPADKPSAAEPIIASHVSSSLAAETLQANLSAIATAQTGSLEAVGSAVGFANVTGDATLTASAAPIVYSKGNISVRQSYTSAVLAGGDMEINQAGAPLIIGKQLNVQQGGALVMLTGESNVQNGFVGVLLTPQGLRQRGLARPHRHEGRAHHRRGTPRRVRAGGPRHGARCAARDDAGVPRSASHSSPAWRTSRRGCSGCVANTEASTDRIYAANTSFQGYILNRERVAKRRTWRNHV